MNTREFEHPHDYNSNARWCALVLPELLNEFGKWGICWAHDGLSDEELGAAQCAQHFCGLVNQDGLPSGATVIEIVLEDLEKTPRLRHDSRQ